MFKVLNSEMTHKMGYEVNKMREREREIAIKSLQQCSSILAQFRFSS